MIRVEKCRQMFLFDRLMRLCHQCGIEEIICNAMFSIDGNIYCNLKIFSNNDGSYHLVAL